MAFDLEAGLKGKSVLLTGATGGIGREVALAFGSVGARVAAVDIDAERVAAIRAMFARFGFPQEASDIRARTVYLCQVGYISMMAEEPLAERLERIPAYIEAFTGQRPSAAEIERFRARHPVPAAGAPLEDRPCA